MTVRLKWLMKFVVMGLCFVTFSPVVFAATLSDTDSVAGFWQTLDGKTKNPSSIIQIKSNGQFYKGTIIKTFSIPGKQSLKVCAVCTGDQKNKPIVGLTIIHHMLCKPGYCSHGTILDPRNGKLYHASMRIVHHGAALKVRGYVGIPLFGKTVVWSRVTQ